MNKFLIFSVLMIALLIVPTVMAGTVTRSLSNNNPQSGDTITVTLSIDAEGNEKAYAIQDTAPFNINGLGSNVYQTVIIDQIGVSDQTKTYQITVQGSGTKTFSGVYRIDGESSDRTIQGTNSLTIQEGGSCTPSSSCAANTCTGQTCMDSCGNSYQGTKDCSGGGTTTPWNINDCIPGTEGLLGQTCISWLVGILILAGFLFIINFIK